MLKVNMEYRKGILFIRLSGELSKYTYKCLNSYLLPMIRNQGIKYIVYNLKNIQLIDNYGINSLKRGIDETKKNLGYGLICNSKIKLKNFKIVDNELQALERIKI